VTTHAHTTDWNALGDRGLADSAAWFPELHVRGRQALAVHYTLGLAGEIGELIHELKPGPSGWTAAATGELADCVIYACDLGRLLELDLNRYVQHEPSRVIISDRPSKLAVFAGLIANQIKKANRATHPDLTEPDLTEHAALIGEWLGSLLTILADLAESLATTVTEAVDSKRQILIVRWGDPTPLFHWLEGGCITVQPNGGGRRIEVEDAAKFPPGRWQNIYVPAERFAEVAEALEKIGTK
jgi:hypothetical protein